MLLYWFDMGVVCCGSFCVGWFRGFGYVVYFRVLVGVLVGIDLMMSGFEIV